MRVPYKQLKVWILHPILLGLVTVTAIACQPNSPGVDASPSSPNPTGEETSADPNAPDRAVYKSDRFDFQFNYAPNDFVIDDAAVTPSGGEDNPLATIDIWTQKHSQAIKAGEYEGGTEYPANVSVTVGSNPQSLSLQEWVQQSNQFGVTREFKSTTVAGQDAIAFQSSGLYENEHVVFASPDGDNVILVTFSKINYGDNDQVYQQAYEQVVNSFAFIGE